MAALLLAFTSSPSGCVDKEHQPASESIEDTGEVATQDEDDRDQGDEDAALPAQKQRRLRSPTPSPSAPAGSASARAEELKHWSPVHAFMSSPTASGRVISATEAIAVTRDNQVGVTTDAGASWGFSKNLSGQVRAVTGSKGGPYAAVGSGGSIRVSHDGKGWADLPRHTGDDLIGVAMLGGTIVAIGKKGTAVRISAQGDDGYAAPLPDKFRAEKLFQHDGQLIAVKGQTGLRSGDGKSWTKLEALPDLPGARSAWTSKGLCKLGRVGKKTGVICEVSGLAHGAGGATFVESKGTMAMSVDGDSWAISKLAFKGVTGVTGSSGGPYFAFGAKGALAASSDGTSWRAHQLDTPHTLRDGLVDGDTILLVGDGGTIVRSADGGTSWSVSQATIGGALKKLVKRGGTYYASMGPKAIASNDGGRTWTQETDPAVIAGLPAHTKPGACEARMPSDGESCTLSRRVTTPERLPNAKGIDFRGETGLAFGETGMVAFTQNGGATWRAVSGFPLKRVQMFEVHGDVVIAVGHSSVIVSSDGGKTFKAAQIPKVARGGLLDVHITDAGTVYACGKKGIILKSEGALELWLPLNTGEKNRTQFLHLFEVGSNLYAAGKNGELFRSSNEGASWRQIPLGMAGQVVMMTGEGDTVFAIMAARRQGGWLLRSDNSGEQFAPLRTFPSFWHGETRSTTEFEYDGATILWGSKASTDDGLNWTRRRDANRARYDLGNGISANISNGRMFVFGSAEHHEAAVILPVHSGSLTCDATTGCWLVSDGRVYRPM